MFRKLYVAATIVLMLVVMGVAITGCPQDTRVRFNVTLQSQAPLQAYAPLVAVTHDNGISLFRETEAVSNAFQNFIDDDALVALVAVLNNLDAVTDVYQSTAGLAGGGTLTFSILGFTDDLLSIAAPASTSATNSFAGLDGVPLPTDTRVWYMDTYTINTAGDAVLSSIGNNVVKVTVTRN